MKFPWISRRRYECELAVLTEQAMGYATQLANATRDADYWRIRCERLLDAALLKQGETHEPVMSNPPAERSNVVAHEKAFGWMRNLNNNELPDVRYTRQGK